MSNSRKKALTASTIAFINVSAICSIKNFPLLAEYGLSVIIYLALAALFFFIPAAFVTAELSSSWPERGIYTWVKEAMGPRMGFVAVWLQWIENVIYYPTILSFIAAAFAYLFDPTLANNKLYMGLTIFITFWLATLVNFLGMRVSGLISSLSVMFGTVIPIILISGLSAAWLFQGNTPQITFSFENIFPKFSSIHELVLLSGVLFGLSGMELSSVHAKDVENARSAYPKGILLSAILILGFSTIGALTIGVVIPKEKIELASSSMGAFQALLEAFNLSFAMPLIAAMVTFGALGTLSTWIVGPSRGLYATAIHGDLPAVFHKTNKRHMPIGILITQGILVSILSLVFFFMPSVNSSYWILLALAAILYQLMYVLMFLSALILKYKKRDVKRAYQVPFGNIGMWIISVFGLIGSFFGFFISFVPPSQFDVGSSLLFNAFLIGLTALFTVVPLLIYAIRKPSWKLKEDPKK